MCTLVILALRRLRQKDCEFETSLGYTVRPLSSYCNKYQYVFITKKGSLLPVNIGKDV
jgi:hypothetical protein